MPARARRDGTGTEQVASPDVPQAPATPAVRALSHTKATPKILAGKLAADPSTRFTNSGKLVSTLRVAEEGKEGQPGTTWTVKAWEKLGEEATEKLGKGAAVKVIGTWEADREYDRADGTGKGSATHEISARDIGVVLGDKTIPLGQFDPTSLDLNAGLDGQSAADAGGMSAAD
jgi:hypothetical protein